MMNLDEAIIHCEEVAEGNEHDAKEYDRLAKLETYPSRKECESAYKRCRKCAKDHRQLAEWLKELKNIYGFIEKYPSTDAIYIGDIKDILKGEI